MTHCSNSPQRWSPDGKHIYFASFRENDPSLFRVRIGDRKIERLASVKDFRLAIGAWGPWPGWAQDDSPLALRDIGARDIYGLLAVARRNNVNSIRF
jgi:Tol biopolymer transport system component